MGFKQQHYFFHCYHCGEVFYSTKKIKRKKCLKCRRSFQVNDYKVLKITPKHAVQLLQFIKTERGKDKDFNYKIVIKQIKKERE